jgi:HTH-type transcriptional regulator/antitoxin HigA
MEITAIKTQRDYRRVPKEIEGLMTAKRNTPEGIAWTSSSRSWMPGSANIYPMDLPDAIEAIKYHVEQSGLEPSDLIPFIGSRNRVQAVLDRKRPLTLKMIQRLHERLGIPAESLIKSGQDRAA